MSPQRNQEASIKNIAFQTELRPALPVVFGAKDYRKFRETIEEVDHFLTATGIEHRMLVAHLKSAADSCPANQRPKSYKTLRQALRYSILLALTGLSHRALSHRVADSAQRGTNPLLEKCPLFYYHVTSMCMDNGRSGFSSAARPIEVRYST